MANIIHHPHSPKVQFANLPYQCFRYGVAVSQVSSMQVWTCYINSVSATMQGTMAAPPLFSTKEESTVIHLWRTGAWITFDLFFRNNCRLLFCNNLTCCILHQKLYKKQLSSSLWEQTKHESQLWQKKVLYSLESATDTAMDTWQMLKRLFTIFQGPPIL